MEQRRARLPEGAGLHALRDLGHPAVLQPDLGGDAAAAGRRPPLRPAIGLGERGGERQAGGQPQDVERVDGIAHARRQVVPPGPSSSKMPCVLSSSRIRSAVAKSRARLAVVR